MNLKKTRLHILRRPENLSNKAKTGVSLHCHTEHSKEMLDFVPHYAEQLPIISYFWKKEHVKYQQRFGKGIDFSDAYWAPPLDADQVYRIEQRQMQNAGLKPLVSLTDHDNIEANLQVNAANEGENAPISMEWTVPFDIGFFHVGVHNLPEDRALDITRQLLDFTFNKGIQTTDRLNEIFAMLNDIPEILIILNHPLWDIEMVGKERHNELLKDFIRVHGRWFHAFEVNGFRKWSENKAVIEMAEALGIPVASGGDRHGCSPNTVINLTDAGTFSEFVEELRVNKRSQIAMMPEYEYPLKSRQLHSFAEILKTYPDLGEHRRRWFDRVFFNRGDGKGLISLSSHGWDKGGPPWLRAATWTLGVMGSGGVRPVFRVFRSRIDRVPKDISSTQFEIPDMSDVRRELASETA